MRQLRVYGTYFRPSSGARATISIMFTSVTFHYVRSSINDAQGTVNKEIIRGRARAVPSRRPLA